MADNKPIDGSVPIHDPRHEHFAAMVAGGKSLTEAYKSCGYNTKGENASHVGGSRLVRNPTVAARIAYLLDYLRSQRDAKIQAELTAAIDEDVRERKGRVEALCSRRRLLLQVILERSRFADHQDVPGGKTGLVVTNRKLVGKKEFKMHQVDIDLLKELRSTEQQIAMERGQWVEKREDVKKVRSVKDMELEEVGALIAEAEEHEKLKAAQAVVAEKAPEQVS